MAIRHPEHKGETVFSFTPDEYLTFVQAGIAPLPEGVHPEDVIRVNECSMVAENSEDVKQILKWILQYGFTVTTLIVNENTFIQ